MRKLIVTNLVTLDGFFEGPGGNFMVMPADASFDAYNLERIRTASTLLVGRTSYEGFRGFWPGLAANEEMLSMLRPDDEAGQEVLREISRRNDDIEKVVVSDSLQADPSGTYGSTTQIVRRGDAREAVRALKEQPGDDIIVFGSHVLWNDLLEAGLVDELHLMIGPVATGGGTPAFTAASPGTLELIGTRQFEGSSNVVMQYAVRS
ncbi:dihydrofolate reductase family protein [Luteipulveratus mongoliensis]|uniref:Bacterial bifunctional deaminase-reductase C-terminal domain-containing protein n=1 Tax=Luteipulveratus mongoliensis TaxID=571913 RepID=A0A0K1JMQ6_9MICO|nr:dihydrofolate reductase family protein [Luteipulveratus mongoliensis]AKU18002.1 hypothetical protein VV02_22625 [Luteipulveratus mongoliensis]